MQWNGFTLLPIGDSERRQFSQWAEDRARAIVEQKIDALRKYDVIAPWEIRQKLDQLHDAVESGAIERAMLGTTQGMAYLLWLHVKGSGCDLATVQARVRDSEVDALKRLLDAVNGYTAQSEASTAPTAAAPSPPRFEPGKTPEERRKSAFEGMADDLGVAVHELADLPDGALRKSYCRVVKTPDVNMTMLKIKLAEIKAAKEQEAKPANG